MKAKVVTVTPAMAEKWLKKNHNKQRPIMQRRVERLASDMKAGAWRLTHQGICFGAGDDLIDGQHRLAAIVASGVTVQLLVCREPSLKFHSPIDRGAARSLALVTGKTNWEIAVINTLFSLEQGVHARGTMTSEDARAIHARNKKALGDLVDVAPDFLKLRSGSAAGLVYAFPISAQRVARYAKDLCEGAMLSQGHAAIVHRRWIDRQRSANYAEAMAALNCIRYHLATKPMSLVHTSDIGYRAVTSRRRELKVPHTPTEERVQHLSFAFEQE